jgi:hypothetical protein
MYRDERLAIEFAMIGVVGQERVVDIEIERVDELREQIPLPGRGRQSVRTNSCSLTPAHIQQERDSYPPSDGVQAYPTRGCTYAAWNGDSERASKRGTGELGGPPPTDRWLCHTAVTLSSP